MNIHSCHLTMAVAMHLKTRKVKTEDSSEELRNKKTLATSWTPPSDADVVFCFFFDSSLVSQLGFRTPDAQKVGSPNVVFDGAARRISWRVEETTGRVTEYVRLDDESENVLH